MKSEVFGQARATQEALDQLEATWRRAFNHAKSGQWPEALAAANEGTVAFEALGDAVKLLHWPECQACYGRPGTAECEDPVYQTRGMCVDRHELCGGNFLGRMHPVQLREWIERQGRHVGAPAPAPSVEEQEREAATDAMEAETEKLMTDAAEAAVDESKPRRKR